MISRIGSFLRYSAPDFWRHPLWKGRRIGPLVRLMRLQLLFALGVRRVHLEWIDGLLLPMERGDKGLTGNYYFGLHEFADMAFAIRLLREGELFVDVGANLGSYSLLAAGVAGARGLAFEPVPDTYERLVQNVEANRLAGRIAPRRIALSTPARQASGETLRFSSDRGCMNSFVEPDYQGSVVAVAVSTLDQECADADPVLIKIDVEGFEQDVLEGASHTLRKSSLLAIIIEGQDDQVNRTLADAGFVDVNYLPLQRLIRPHAETTSNRIWVRRAELARVQDRLLAASAHNVFGAGF